MPPLCGICWPLGLMIGNKAKSLRHLVAVAAQPDGNRQADTVGVTVGYFEELGGPVVFSRVEAVPGGKRCRP